MRLQELIGIVRENVMFALFFIFVFGILLCIGLLLYKKFGGTTRISRKRLLLIAIFSMYLMMVLGVTVLNRGANFQGLSLSLFSSYRDAWHNFSMRGWQNIYLNILMFVPFGFLLPFFHTRFEKVRWTGAISLLFTLTIESLQYITGYGIFDLDDIWNNFLGAMIGFGLIQSFKALKRKLLWRTLAYLSPLLLVILLSGTMFTYYNAKDFGNLSIVPATKVNMNNITVSSTISFSDDKPSAPVFQAPRKTSDEAKEFAFSMFDKLQLDTTDIEIIDYQNEAYYRYHGDPDYHIWVNYLDGSYSYIDFSDFSEDVKLTNQDEESLKERLKPFDIIVPEQAHFDQLEEGTYKWSVDLELIDEQLINGTLMASYYNDNTVKGIEQQMVVYEKVRDVSLKSEKEAFEEVLEGRFKLYLENKKNHEIQIKQVEIGYQLDTKGFYQPVYKFNVLVDGEETEILIPGIK